MHLLHELSRNPQRNKTIFRLSSIITLVRNHSEVLDVLTSNEKNLPDCRGCSMCLLG